MNRHSSLCPLCNQETTFTVIGHEHCFDCTHCGSFRVAMDAEDRLRGSRPVLRKIWSQMSQAAPENYYLAVMPAEPAGPLLSMVGLNIRYRALETRGGNPCAAPQPHPPQ